MTLSSCRLRTRTRRDHGGQDRGAPSYAARSSDPGLVAVHVAGGLLTVASHADALSAMDLPRFGGQVRAVATH